jgi:hypothetical protein
MRGTRIYERRHSPVTRKKFRLWLLGWRLVEWQATVFLLATVAVHTALTVAW